MPVHVPWRPLMGVVVLLVAAGTLLTAHQWRPTEHMLQREVVAGGNETMDGDRTSPSATQWVNTPQPASSAYAQEWTSASQQQHKKTKITPSLACGAERVAVALPETAVNHSRCIVDLSADSRDVPSVRVSLRGAPRIATSGNLSDVIACPNDAALLHLPVDDRGHDTELHTSHVVAKYKGYAKRCVRNNGIMWAALSRGMHDRVYAIVLDAFMGLKSTRVGSDAKAGTASNVSSHVHRPGNANRRPVHVLDWGCGCGLTLQSLETLLAGKIQRHGRSIVERHLRFELPATPPYLQGLGVDVIRDAIVYANHVFKTPHHSFCHADGTQVGRWLPEGQFDWITSFAGLAHVPDASRCRVVSMLLRLLRPGGAMWSGYVPYETALQFAACTPSRGYVVESTGSGLVGGVGTGRCCPMRVSVVKERVAWAKARVHRYYQNHYSVFWEAMRDC